MGWRDGHSYDYLFDGQRHGIVLHPKAFKSLRTQGRFTLRGTVASAIESSLADRGVVGTRRPLVQNNLVTEAVTPSRWRTMLGWVPKLPDT